MTITVVGHPAAEVHDPGPGHPEAPVRMRVIEAALARDPVPGLVRKEAPKASREQLERAHVPDHVDLVFTAEPESGRVGLDGDTIMSPGSLEAGLRSAGGACAAVDAVVGGEALRAFSCMRPPGHHAEADRAMGFCLFNSIAIAALHARHVHGLGRIAIFDFDVHHGNGTQAIFWNDPETLYLSTHQMPLYPGTGARTETGVRGNIVNRPCAPGTGSAAWRKLVEAEILPRIDAFAPDLVMASAGFDAHMRDPLAQMELVEADYRWVGERLVEIAERHASGRVVSVLEGGYDPPALAASVTAHLEGLSLRA